MAEWEQTAILSTLIKLPFIIKFYGDIFEWPFYTGFTVYIERTFAIAGFIIIITTWPHQRSLYESYFKVLRLVTTSVNERTDHSDFSLDTPLLMHEFSPNNLLVCEMIDRTAFALFFFSQRHVMATHPHYTGHVW